MSAWLIDPNGLMPLTGGRSFFARQLAREVGRYLPNEGDVASFFFGIGDTITFGAAGWLSSLLGADTIVDRESSAHGWGTVCGIAGGSIGSAAAFTLRAITRNPQAVVRWFSNHSGLRTNAWVMVGEGSVRNWLFSGVASPFTPHFRALAQNAVHNVAKADLVWPRGIEWLKGLLGQRIYIGPPIP
jgi:hypothetical protein